MLRAIEYLSGRRTSILGVPFCLHLMPVEDDPSSATVLSSCPVLRFILIPGYTVFRAFDCTHLHKCKHPVSAACPPRTIRAWKSTCPVAVLDRGRRRLLHCLVDLYVECLDISISCHRSTWRTTSPLDSSLPRTCELSPCWPVCYSLPPLAFTRGPRPRPPAGAALLPQRNNKESRRRRPYSLYPCLSTPSLHRKLLAWPSLVAATKQPHPPRQGRACRLYKNQRLRPTQLPTIPFPQSNFTHPPTSATASLKHLPSPPHFASPSRSAPDIWHHVRLRR